MLSDYSNRFASQSLALAPLACLSLTASAGIPLQYPATQARFARRLVPGPFAPAVLRLAPGAALQDGRQLHEGRMEFAQAIPRQPLVVPVVAVRVMETLEDPGCLRDAAQGDRQAAAIVKLACLAVHGFQAPRSIQVLSSMP